MWRGAASLDGSAEGLCGVMSVMSETGNSGNLSCWGAVHSMQWGCGGVLWGGVWCGAMRRALVRYVRQQKCIKFAMGATCSIGQGNAERAGCMMESRDEYTSTKLRSLDSRMA